MSKIGVDPDCVELARKFLDAAYTAEAPSEKRVAAELQSLSEDIQTAIEDWFLVHPADQADANCTCRPIFAGPTDIDPPEGRILGRDCPVHGRDPDADRERLRDDAP